MTTLSLIFSDALPDAMMAALARFRWASLPLYRSVSTLQSLSGNCPGGGGQCIYAYVYVPTRWSVRGAEAIAR